MALTAVDVEGFFLFLMTRIVSGSCYAFLSLHCARHGISLVRLGVAATVGQLLRIAVPILAGWRRVPLWKLKLPTSMLPMLSGALALRAGDVDEQALFLHLVLLILGTVRPAEKAVALKIWRELGSDKAKGVHEGIYAMGYSLSSFVGAALYSSGGWHFFLTAQLCGSAFVCAVLLHLQRRWGDEDAPVEPVEQPSVELPPVEQPVVEEETVGVRTRFYLMCFGLMLVCFTYGNQYQLYSVYLTEKFGTSLLILGATQMAGDIGGACILLFSASTWARRCEYGLDCVAVDPIPNRRSCAAALLVNNRAPSCARRSHWRFFC
jgi:hypothetical protein